MRILSCLFLFFVFISLNAQTSFQQKLNSMYRIQLENNVTLTFDEPQKMDKKKPTKVIIFALPNGNTTVWSYGKKIMEGEDWHYNIQHIGAQTEFIRNTDQSSNYIVVYAENSLKAWPAWRQKYADSNARIKGMVEMIYKRYQVYKPEITLSCHSGGGSFIVGYINSQDQIPDYVERIGFLDATYGYETEKHLPKLSAWLNKKNHFLEVITYNDSVVIYNGKPLVSPTGGTWYRSKLMAKDLNLKETENDSLIYCNDSEKKKTEIILIKNPNALIFHTVLVEKNGFIHLVFNNTPYALRNYGVWEERAYENYILK